MEYLQVGNEKPYPICPYCNGKMLIIKEIIETTGGPVWFDKHICIDKKTTGCN